MAQLALDSERIRPDGAGDGAGRGPVVVRGRGLELQPSRDASQ